MSFMVRSYRVERVVAWWQMWSALSLYLGWGLGLSLNHFFLGVWHEHPIFYTGIYFTSLKGTLISRSGWVSFKRSSWLAIKRMGGRCWCFEDVSFLSWWVLVQIKVTWTKNCTFAFVCSAIIILGIGVGLSSLVFFCELLPKITLKLKLCINQKKNKDNASLWALVKCIVIETINRLLKSKYFSYIDISLNIKDVRCYVLSPERAR